MDDHSIGYRRPPKHSQYRKGQSGNPKGRPSGRHRLLPYDSILGEIVTIRENGEEREVTAAEAFVLQMIKRGLEGDVTAARLALATMQELYPERDVPEIESITRVIIGSDPNIPEAIADLRIGYITGTGDASRLKLAPWIIEAALARLDRQLTRSEQAEIWRNTKTPHKVKWPKWWQIKDAQN